MSEVRTGSRIDFSDSTKKLVADRAGNECSFPTCDHRTTASEALPGLVSRSGKASHIYSAAENGPRGRGGLTEEELKSPENCIWLCSNHATIIDNNRGIAYPPEELIAYKALQEARISRERQGLFIPVGWLFELVIRQSPIFQSGQRIRLAKLNLILGSNSTGKTAVTEWIAGFFAPEYLKRWQRWDSKLIDLQLTLLNPSSHVLRLQIGPGESLVFFVRETSDHKIERTLYPVAEALLELLFSDSQVFSGFGAARFFPDPLGFDFSLRHPALLFRPLLGGLHCGSVYHRRIRPAYTP